MAPCHSYGTCTRFVLITLGVSVLAGCSPRAAIVGAGSAAVGAVSAAGSAAGSLIGGAGSAASNAAGAVGGGTGGGTGGAGGAGTQAVDAPSQAVRAGAAAPASTVRSFRNGIAQCLDALGTAEVAATLVSEGWVASNTAQSGAAPGGDERRRAFAKDGVRGSILRGQRCSFVTEALAGPTGRAIALEALTDRVGTGVTSVAPAAQEGPCAGYTFDLDGQSARMDFTSANGGDCTGPGAGVTITLI